MVIQDFKIYPTYRVLYDEQMFSYRAKQTKHTVFNLRTTNKSLWLINCRLIVLKVFLTLYFNFQYLIWKKNREGFSIVKTTTLFIFYIWGIKYLQASIIRANSGRTCDHQRLQSVLEQNSFWFFKILMKNMGNGVLSSIKSA